MVSKIIHFIIMSCSQATLLVEKQFYNELSWLQKIRLKAHLKMCKCCNSYFSKAKKIDNILKRSIQDTPAKFFQNNEIEDFKDRLRKNIKL